MKKLLLIIIAALVNIFTIKAQHIPDKNFAAAIREVCAECIDSKNNLLPAAKKLKDLSGSYDSIHSIAGIGGFSSLEYLYLPGNEISVLPSLPASLLNLNCSFNKLTALPELPPGLIMLICSDNNISNLPHLPVSLKQLHLNGTKVKTLPVLPAKLEQLDCSATLVNKLPLLPASLIMLYCNKTGIISLPEIPHELKQLSVYDSKITLLPELPDQLDLLEINSSVINCIPCNSSHLKITDFDSENGRSKEMHYCTGYTPGAKAADKTEYTRKDPPPLLFFDPSYFITAKGTSEEDPITEIQSTLQGTWIIAASVKPEGFRYPNVVFTVSYNDYRTGTEITSDRYDVRIKLETDKAWKLIHLTSKGDFIIRAYEYTVTNDHLIGEGKLRVN